MLVSETGQGEYKRETIVEVSLEDLDGKIDQILQGKHVGRTIVNLEL